MLIILITVAVIIIIEPFYTLHPVNPHNEGEKLLFSLLYTCGKGFPTNHIAHWLLLANSRGGIGS